MLDAVLAMLNALRPAITLVDAEKVDWSGVPLLTLLAAVRNRTLEILGLPNGFPCVLKVCSHPKMPCLYCFKAGSTFAWRLAPD